METTTNEPIDEFELTRENNRLLTENNQLLKKIDKRARTGFWFKVVLYLVIFGLPLLFYSFFMNSLSTMLGVGTQGGDSNNSSTLTDTANNAKQILDLLRSQ
ncbi:hypothetical protein A2592_03610 [Candidatus Kaiserbacteria bacterium RIFOXYD1_FULL_42_15]|uniref:Uncharacterized protein n=1 Tax=Candidatus Kaiserbacteria bacterium RIFOXYD1_FULL_42_15 TaxID=1798532 RepID=A0A1F6FPU6_9BACT|nr:MAG: hypothetical protein A2592_03610 [Candidatus Kaiserbacteria bacterium RIFOXYD1_FULL_42_15]